MITIYHLGVSQSDRVVWLMEELGLPYRLEWFDRGPDRLAPAEYLALHPAATAPVIRDGDRVLTESAAILEYICQIHGEGRLSVGPSQPNYPDYLYWMHFNNNVQGMFFARRALQRAGLDPEGDTFIRRREGQFFGYLEQRLGQSEHLAGSAFTCADIMVAFNLTTLPRFGGRKLDDLPNTLAYVERICARPAYVRAMAIAGPAAVAPPKAERLDTA